jgi:hypothetical protein
VAFASKSLQQGSYPLSHYLQQQGLQGPADPTDLQVQMLEQAWAAAARMRQDRTSALLATLSAGNQQQVEYLQKRGQLLLDQLGETGTNDLNAFVQRALYDLDQNREISGPNARPGYGGISRFAPHPTMQQVQGLPGYAALQAAQATRARFTASQQQLEQENAQARGDLQLQQASTNAALDQQALDQDYQARIQQARMNAALNAYRSQFGSSSGGGGGGGGSLPKQTYKGEGGESEADQYMDMFNQPYYDLNQQPSPYDRYRTGGITRRRRRPYAYGY